MKVALVGTGLIGRSWAMAFAAAGWDVALYDPAPGVAATARALAGDGLADLAALGRCADPAAAQGRLQVAASLEDALAGAGLVQESGPEILATKQATLAELDRLAAPDTILASSTSAFQCSLLTEALAGRGRCLVAHPVNPPHLIPLVELSGAIWTDPATLAAAQAIFTAIGAVPIRVLKEIDGFILNRLQAALLSEAFRLVEDGHVGPQDLDRTVRDGLGLRWALMGPFEAIELNAPDGIPDYVRRGRAFFQRYLAAPPGPEVWSEERVEVALEAWGPGLAAEAIVAKSRQRDRQLAALRNHRPSAVGTDRRPLAVSE